MPRGSKKQRKKRKIPFLSKISMSGILEKLGLKDSFKPERIDADESIDTTLYADNIDEDCYRDKMLESVKYTDKENKKDLDVLEILLKECSESEAARLCELIFDLEKNPETIQNPGLDKEDTLSITATDGHEEDVLLMESRFPELPLKTGKGRKRVNSMDSDSMDSEDIYSVGDQESTRSLGTGSAEEAKQRQDTLVSGDFIARLAGCVGEKAKGLNVGKQAEKPKSNRNKPIGRSSKTDGSPEQKSGKSTGSSTTTIRRLFRR